MDNHQDPGARAFRYAGFISYSQKDKKWAKRIHRALEAYRLPTGLPPELAQGKRLGRFFRDDDELAGAPSLSDALESSLDSAATLIVVCSPNSARSKWVDAEIRRFKSRGSSARVLAVIVEGKPDSPDPEVMCFPPSLLRRVDENGDLTEEPDEPLAPDANKEPFNRLITRLVAGLLGLEFDTLWQRAQRRRRRQQLLLGAAAVITAVGIGVGTMMYLHAEQDRKLAQIEQMRTESLNLAALAQQAMDEGRVDDALIASLDALPHDLHNPQRPITPQAVAALKRLMNTNFATGIVAQLDQAIDEIHLLPDGRLAVWLSDSSVRVLNPESGVTEWQSPEGSRLNWLGGSELAAMVDSDETLDSEGKIQVEHKIDVIDLVNGETLRQLRSDDNSWWMGPFAPLSPSADRVLLKRSVSAKEEEKDDLVVWQLPQPGDTAPVRVLGKIHGPQLADDELLGATFIDDETLLLSWGNPRSSVALWRLGEEQLHLITEENTPLHCDGQHLDKDRESWDSIAISQDRKYLSHARPIKDGGWCVQIWDTASGDPLKPMVLDRSGVGSAEVLSPGNVVTSASSRHYASARLWQHNDEYSGFACKSERVSQTLRPFVVDENRWLIDTNLNFSACIDDETIQAYSGRNFSVGHTFYGHSAAGALAFNPQKRQLFSAGSDGVIRAWDISRIQNTLPGDRLFTGGLISANGMVTARFQGTDYNFYTQLFNPDGEALSPPLPFAIKYSDLVEQQQELDRAQLLLNNGESLALMEASQCHFNCGSNEPYLLTLFRASDGKELAQIDRLYSGHFLSDIPLSLATTVNGNRLALPRRDGTIIELDTTTGEQLHSHTIDGWHTTEVAYINDNLWVMGSSQEEDYEKREVALFRVENTGNITQAWKHRAQSGQLHSSPSGRHLLLELSQAHLPGNPTLYVLLQANGEVQVVSMPEDIKLTSGRLEYAYFYANDTRLSLLESDGGAAAIDIDLTTGIASRIGTSLPSSMFDTWRVEDPLGRVAGSVDHNQLYLLPLPGQQPVCPEMNGRAADAATFSPDGRLFAIAEYYDHKLTIYDLESCTRIYSADFGLRNNGQMRFVDANSLWTIMDNGELRIIRLLSDLASMHREASELRKALGLAQVSSVETTHKQEP